VTAIGISSSRGRNAVASEALRFDPVPLPQIAEMDHPLRSDDLRFATHLAHWWADELACSPDELEEDEAPATADVEGLRRFLETMVLRWFETQKKEAG
jgi:hypothetical protein